MIGYLHPSGKWHIVGWSEPYGYGHWTPICGNLAPVREHETWALDVLPDPLCGNCRRIAKDGIEALWGSQGSNE